MDWDLRRRDCRWMDMISCFHRQVASSPLGRICTITFRDLYNAMHVGQCTAPGLLESASTAR